MSSEQPVRTERSFKRFTLGQRWEHTLLLLSFTILALTGLPQKYRTAGWSQWLLSTPERVETVQNIHHIAAIALTLEVLYHLGKGVGQLARRRLPGEMLPHMQDVGDAFQMVKYLLFLSKEKPAAGKYNFEQKITYWFLFFGIAILVVTGFIQWFPEAVTRVLPGGVVPAARLAHSTEAIIAVVFVLVWHFYHVHLERLNLSIFTGRLSEEELRKHHRREYDRLTGGGQEERKK